LKILFVTWDGPQVTYLESLFLPIFSRLTNDTVQFHVLQFTWGNAKRIDLTRQACGHLGISYQAVSIWRRPRAIGAMVSALFGSRHVKKAIHRHNIDVVMSRSTLPALATLLALRGTPYPMVFDADGLPLDERVDFAGQSPTSLVHRILRDVEALAVQRAAVVLTRSAKAVDILQARAGAGTALDKFHVVTNGRDAERFKPADAAQSAQTRRELGLAVDAPLLVYAGSLGSQYCLEEMLRLFALIRERRADAHWLILTGSPESVQPALGKHPQLQESITIQAVGPQAVPQYLACADLGLALRQSSFSMQAVAPIKLGEYLLCGLPVLATADIGDTDVITTDVGYLIRGMNGAALEAAADWFVDSVLTKREAYRESSRAAGLKRFSLEASFVSYTKALDSLVANT
jgi:glycosyltransferase involved in cell wall biosynthesis